MCNDTMGFTGVSLCIKSGKIRIFHSTIKELGNPKYIRFLLNPDRKTFAIQSCRNKVPESILVPKYTSDNWDFVVHSMTMLRGIWKICGWDEEKTYRMDGICFPEHDLVEFDLKQAEMLKCDEIENI